MGSRSTGLEGTKVGLLTGTPSGGISIPLGAAVSNQPDPGAVAIEGGCGHNRMAMERPAVVRYIYLTAGLVSIGLAIVGTVVPVLPTVPLVLLAGFFFSRSSERFDDWLVQHRVFGPIIRDWRAGLGFSRRDKTIAVVAIVLSFGLTISLAVDSIVGRVSMIALAIAVITYVVSRPTKVAVED